MATLTLQKAGSTLCRQVAPQGPIAAAWQTWSRGFKSGDKKEKPNPKVYHGLGDQRGIELLRDPALNKVSNYS